MKSFIMSSLLFVCVLLEPRIALSQKDTYPVVVNPDFLVYDTSVPAPRNLSAVYAWDSNLGNVVHGLGYNHSNLDPVIKIFISSDKMSFSQSLYTWKDYEYTGSIEISTCTPSSLNNIYFVMTNEDTSDIPKTGQIIFHIPDSTTFSYNVTRSFKFSFKSDRLYKRLVVYSEGSTLSRGMEFHKINFRLLNYQFNAGDDRTICLNEYTRLGGDTLSQNGPTVYGCSSFPQWRTEYSNSVFSTESNPSVSPSITTRYYLMTDNNIRDSVTVYVNPCLCEWPTQLNSSNDLTPIDVVATPNYVYNLYHLTGSQLQTPFCNYPVYSNTSSGSKILLAVHRKDGTLKTIRSLNVTELYPGVEPVVCAVNDNVIISIGYKGTIFDFDNNTNISNSSAGKFATNVLCFNNEGAVLWQQNMTSVNGNIYGCDLTVGSSVIYVMGNKPYGRIGSFTTNQGTFIAYINKTNGSVTGAATIGSSYSWPSITTITFNGSEALLSNQCGTFKVFSNNTLLNTFPNLYSSLSASSKDKVFYNGDDKIWVLDEPDYLYGFTISTRPTLNITPMSGTWPYSIPNSSFVDMDCDADTLYFSTNYRKGDDKFHFLLTYNATLLQKANEAQTDGEAFFGLDKENERIYSSDYNSPTTSIRSFDLNLVAEGCNKLYVDAGNNRTICAVDTITIGGSPSAWGGSGSYNYQWQSSPATTVASVSNPSVSPDENTIFTILATDSSNLNNCKYDEMQIFFSEECCPWPKKIIKQHIIYPYIFSEGAFVEKSIMSLNSSRKLSSLIATWNTTKNTTTSDSSYVVFDDYDTVFMDFVASSTYLFISIDSSGNYLFKKTKQGLAHSIHRTEDDRTIVTGPLHDPISENYLIFGDTNSRYFKISIFDDQGNLSCSRIIYSIHFMPNFERGDKTLLFDSTLFFIGKALDDTIDGIEVPVNNVCLFGMNINTLEIIRINPLYECLPLQFSYYLSIIPSIMSFQKSDSSIWFFNSYDYSTTTPKELNLYKFSLFSNSFQSITITNEQVPWRSALISPKIINLETTNSNNSVIIIGVLNDVQIPDSVFWQDFYKFRHLTVDFQNSSYTTDWINNNVITNSLLSEVILYNNEVLFCNEGLMKINLTTGINSLINDNLKYYCNLFLLDSLLYIQDYQAKYSILNLENNSINCDIFWNKETSLIGVEKDEIVPEQKNVYCYPNPFSEEIRIYIPGYNNILAKIYDMNGQLLLKTSSLIINARSFSQGIYVVIVQDEESNIIYKGKLLKISN
ncbi:MAG: T9SS type A sorting domain-containing protein [Bacteroidales bacterium]|nr:T9SS type A sorting domain-containing protein [Bacteroidales bacterium]MDD3665422.1 T9SS type A sorting domain-containing protein [Bacteroidales bacterium]